MAAICFWAPTQVLLFAFTLFSFEQEGKQHQKKQYVLTTQDILQSTHFTATHADVLDVFFGASAFLAKGPRIAVTKLCGAFARIVDWVILTVSP